ncbi:MAG: hypothetical protein AAGE43_21105 [Pseudomonadota bacterium]
MMRHLTIAVLLLGLGGCEFTGGAETLVRGSNNFVAREAGPDSVAFALSQLDSTPEVTDAEIRQIYDSIQARALDGDLEAVRVVLRLAEIQRTPPEDEEDS